MATRMTESAWRAFVSEGTRTAKLATMRADGQPHVVPIWFVLDDSTGDLVFTVGVASLKAKAMARDPRVALCVDDENGTFAFVEVLGTVTLSGDVEAMLPWATRIAARYRGAARAEEFGIRNAVPEELLVRLTTTRVVAVAGVAE